MSDADPAGDPLDAVVDLFIERLRKADADVDEIRRQFIDRYPQFGDELVQRLRVAEAVRDCLNSSGAGAGSADGITVVEAAQAVQCPYCGNSFRLISNRVLEATCNSCGSHVDVSNDDTVSLPTKDLSQIGPFEIQQRIGQGGFGTAYQAVDPRLGRVVAIKVPRSGRFLNAVERERFVREARTAARLRHPHIVQVHEISSGEDQPYIVSDYIDGPNLAQLIDSQKLQFSESVRILVAVAEATQFAHDHGVIHRDLKPSNILLDASLNPYVTDFGLARSLEAEFSVTTEGEILGTPAYMSPEQASGNTGVVDARSDVYSLGVILYRMCCGELPFRGPQRMQLMQVINEEPRTPRSIDDRIPVDLETIALKAMAKEQGRRYQSAKEMADDLRRWLNDEPIRARRIGVAGKLLRWRRRHPQLAGLLGTIAALLLVISALSTGWALREQHLTFVAEQNEDRAVAGENASHRRLVQSLTQNGLHAMSDDRYGESSLWFAKALELERDDEEPHRRRFANVQRQLPRLTLLTAVPERVISSALTADGTLLILGSSGGSCRIVDLASGQIIREQQYDDPIDGIVISEASSRFALVLRNNGLILLDTDDTSMEEKIVHESRVLNATFSTDGSLLVSCGADGKAIIHSLAEDAPDVELEHPLTHVAHAKLTANDQLLTVCHDELGENSEARRWSLNSGEQAGGTFRLPGRVRHVALNEAPSAVVMTSDNGAVAYWGSGESENFTTAAISLFARESFLLPLGRVLTVYGNGTLTIRSRSGKILHEVRHAGPVSATAIDRESGLLLTAESGGGISVRLLESLQTVSAVFGASEAVQSIRLRPDHRQVVVVSEEGVIRVWDLAGLAPAVPLMTHSDEIKVARFSPDGRFVVTCSADQNARLWDATSGQKIGRDMSHPDRVTDCDFRSDGRLLATGCVDGNVRLFDISGRQIGDPIECGGPVLRVRFSPTLGLLAASTSTGQFSAWTIPDRQPLFELSGEQPVVSVQFSPDGNLIAAGSRDGTVTVVDSDGILVSQPLVHPQSILKLSWSPDSSVLATCCEDGHLRLWNVTRPAEDPVVVTPAATPISAMILDEQLRTVSAGNGGYLEYWTPLDRLWTHQQPDFRWYHVAASTDRAMLAASGTAVLSGEALDRGNGAALLLSTADGTLLSPPLRHSATVRRVQFHPAEERVLTGSYDGTARIWRIDADRRDTADIVRLAQLMTGRLLDEEGRVQGLQSNQLVTLFDQMKSASPGWFSCSDDEVARWSDFIAHQVEGQQRPVDPEQSDIEE